MIKRKIVIKDEKKVRTSMSFYFSSLTLLIILIMPILTINSLQVSAEIGSYTENFTDTAYMDETATTAEGWGGGSLINPKRDPYIIGSRDTPSSSYAVCIEGNYAYIADQNSGIRVINITNPSNPEQVGFYDTDGTAYSVEVDGNYAYVADFWGRFTVLNVTNPTTPTFIANLFTPGAAHDVWIDGDYAYLAAWNEGLQIVNITNPKNPSLLAHYDTLNYAHSLVVDGNYVYLSNRESGLYTFNVTNPSLPENLDRIDSDGNYYGLVVDGDILYVAVAEEGFKILNISNPLQVSEIRTGTYGILKDCRDVDLYENFLYVADDTNGVFIFDVHDPSNPILIGSCDTPGHALGIKIDGINAFIADGDSGLQIVQIADSISPNLITTYTPQQLFDSANDISIDGNYAFVAEDGCLRVLNITDPSSPNDVGKSFSTSWFFSGIEVSGNYAYLARDSVSQGVAIFNVSNPSSIHLPINSITDSGTYFTNDVCISGNLAFVAERVGDDNGKLLIVNITDPFNPNYVGSYSSAYRAFAVTVEGNLAYIANGAGGLLILNISNPTNPSFISRYDTQYAQDIAVSGNYVFVADYQWGVKIIDVSNPSIPIFKAEYVDLSKFMVGITVRGDFLYIATDSSVLKLNITDPSNPNLIGDFNTQNEAQNLIVTGDFAFVAESETGIRILEVNRNLGRKFTQQSQAQSIILTSIPENSLIELVELSSSYISQPNTYLHYYISADGGLHWEEVSRNHIHLVIYPGKDLLWRVSLHSYQWNASPELLMISITYEYKLPSVSEYFNLGFLFGIPIIFMYTILSLRKLRCFSNKRSD